MPGQEKLSCGATLLDVSAKIVKILINIISKSARHIKVKIRHFFIIFNRKKRNALIHSDKTTETYKRNFRKIDIYMLQNIRISSIVNL